MIWTIYNHGTGGSSLKGSEKGEIVNLFGNNDRRQQFKGKIITEGVGSIGDPHKIANEFSRSGSGEYFVTKTQDGRASGAARGVKSATGGGVQENVDNTVELIRALNLANNKPDAINMIGWSRGAVTCIRIAWKLYQSEDSILRSIPINIFAVDPVAGAGHTNEVDANTVTPNVRNYFATLATGEKRRFFKPIAGNRLNVQSPAVTRSWVLPMPGHHSDTAKNNNNIGRIVFSLADRFLSGCGTAVPPMRHYSLDNLKTWKMYEELIIGKEKVHKTSIGSQLAMGLIGYKRKGESKVHNYGEDFFPNVHARIVMQAAYPITYEAYFGPSNVDKRNTAAWATQNTARVTAEQRQLGMSAEMNRILEALPPGAGGALSLPSSVGVMAVELGLID